MNIRDLKYLVALSKHRHFGKAAAACFVSQPALSMQIKKLETLLQVRLLERTNKSFLLTEIGVAITARARQVLQELDELVALAKLAKDPYCGKLKLGIIPTLAPYLLPLLMPALAKKFAKLTFYLIEAQTDALLEKLISGKLDAALLVLPIEDTRLVQTPLFKEAFSIAVSHTHALAQHKIIKQLDLAQHQLLLLEEGHCMRAQTLALCQRLNIAETHNFRATSLETLRHMVAAGNSMTLMPKLAQQAHDGLTYIPFSAPQPTRTVAVCWRKQTAKQVLLADLAMQLKKLLLKYKSLTVL